MHDVNEHFLKL